MKLLYYIQTVYFFIFTVSCGNSPFISIKPKAKVEPIVSFLAAENAVSSLLNLEYSSCADAEEVKVGAVRSGSVEPNKMKFYKLINDGDTDSFYISFYTNVRTEDSCVFIGKENQIIDSNSSMSLVDYPASSAQPCYYYTYIEISKNSYRCIGTAAYSKATGYFHSYWSSSADTKPNPTGFSPSSGPPGTIVTVTGKGLAPSSSYLDSTTNTYKKQDPDKMYMYDSSGNNKYTYSLKASYSQIKFSFPNYMSSGNVQSSNSGGTVYGTFTKTASPAMYARSTPACTYNAVSGTPIAFKYTTGDSSKIPIGFPFSFFGVVTEDLYVHTSGSISFIEGYLSPSSISSPVTSGSSYGLVLHPWSNSSSGTDSNSSVQYLLSGTEGSRILTIQWSNYLDYYYIPYYRLNFQVKLYEGTNVAEFIYGTKTGSGAGVTANVGIKNAVGGSGNFMDGISGSTVTATSYSSNSGFPAPNTCYRFTP